MQFPILYLGDCLHESLKIPNHTVDAIICDPPYGTTSCKWDTVIPFDLMWDMIYRVLKPNGTVLLFGTEPFSSMLRLSNIKNYKYDLIWKKSKCGSPLTAKYRPLSKHENISVFCSTKTKYNPQMSEGKPYRRKYTPSKSNNHGFGISGVETDNKGTRYPQTILDFPQKWRRQDQVHPTQKPVELLEYLVRTYTDEGETILDFTMGSGSTGIACLKNNRNFIGIESDKGYYDIAVKRCSEA